MKKTITLLLVLSAHSKALAIHETLINISKKDEPILGARKRIEHCTKYPSYQNSKGQHALHFLAGKPLTKGISCYIKALKTFINVQDNTKCTPLMYAKDPHMVAFLVAQKANPDITDINGHTALAYNIIYPKPLNVCLLLEHGAKQIKDNNKNNLLHICNAIKENYLDELQNIEAIGQINEAHRLRAIDIDTNLKNIRIIKNLLKHKQTAHTASLQKKAISLIKNNIQFNPHMLKQREIGL